MSDPPRRRRIRAARRTVFRVLAVAAACAAAACAAPPPRPDLAHDPALPAETRSRLDTALAAVEAAHPGQSGFRLVREGPEAFAIRARTAQLAERSLDVQTYIWHADLTGSFLAAEMLNAADRGVRVRLLVDDWDARARNAGFAALDAHPNIAVRVFNPFRSRGGGLALLLEAAGSFGRINRRMHNKTWIADNRVAIAGGRNLGDEYFGASDGVNFIDLDFAMVGPVVRDASAAFDSYWNSPSAYPMAELAPQQVAPSALAELRGRLTPLATAALTSRFASELGRDEAVQRLVGGDWPLEWSAEYRFVADDPGKVAGTKSGLGGSRVLEVLYPMVRDARRNTHVVSPYFVPGEGGTGAFVALAATGCDVRILTNSLAANDVAAVYGGYSVWRKPLLAGGVRLFELKPEPGRAATSSLFGSSGASLHTKALTVDGERLFVGSFNLDPRSTSLNTEQGIFVHSPVLARQLDAVFARQTAAEHAWEVRLDAGGDLTWDDGGVPLTRTPEASLGRKFQAWLARILPVSSQL